MAANSASSALHLGCLALGIKKNDIVWTVPNTFAASANCAINCGATIDFVDIDKDTWNISIDKLSEKLIKAKKKKNYLNLLYQFILQVRYLSKKKFGNFQKNTNLKYLRMLLTQ